MCYDACLVVILASQKLLRSIRNNFASLQHLHIDMARHHHHHHRHRKSHRKHSDDPLSLLFNLSSLFVAAIALCFAIRPAFTIRWVISGAPLLTYSILLGDSQGHRILPFVPLWTIVSTLNLVYAVAATSWLLYYFFLAACYPTIFFSALFQFDYVANFCRTKLRTLLQQLQFVNDKIAFFDIPALEVCSGCERYCDAG